MSFFCLKVLSVILIVCISNFFEKLQKKFNKPLEIPIKVVYNGCKWRKVENSGRKWGVSGRPHPKEGEFIVNRRI